MKKLFLIVTALLLMTVAQASAETFVRRMDVHWSDGQGRWLALWEFVGDEGSFSLVNPHGVAVCEGVGTATTCDCDWMVVEGGGWAACSFRNLARFKTKNKNICEVTLWRAGVPVAAWRGPCKE